VDTETLAELDIVRLTLIPVSLRAAGSDTEADAPAELPRDVLGVMDVRFSPFNSWYEVNSWWEGNFMERTVPGAFKRTIGQHNDPNSSHNMKTLFNHGMDFHVGDKLLGDITDLREEADSPVSTVNLWDTSYNRDLLPGLSRGSYGSSFMFRVTKEKWDNEPEASDTNPKGLPERTITETHTLEAGPVTWPANPVASAGMRCYSGTDAYYERLAQRDPERVERMRERVTSLRASGRLAPVGAQPELVLVAGTPIDDSAPGRSSGLSPAQRREILYPGLRG
jgi:HK97 family phage prohead protease